MDNRSRSAIINHIVHNIKFLEDSKTSILHNLDQILQNIAPSINIINCNSDQLNLNELNDFLQYQLKLVILMSNISLVTMDFLKNNKTPTFHSSTHQIALSPEEQLLQLLCRRLNLTESTGNSTNYIDLLAIESLSLNNNSQTNNTLPNNNINNNNSIVINRTMDLRDAIDTNGVSPTSSVKNNNGSTSLHTSQNLVFESDTIATDLCENSPPEEQEVNAIKENIKKLSAKLNILTNNVSSISPKYIPSSECLYQLPEKDISSSEPIALNINALTIHQESCEVITHSDPRHSPPICLSNFANEDKCGQLGELSKGPIICPNKESISIKPMSNPDIKENKYSEQITYMETKHSTPVCLSNLDTFQMLEQHSNTPRIIDDQESPPSDSMSKPDIQENIYSEVINDIERKFSRPPLCLSDSDTCERLELQSNIPIIVPNQDCVSMSNPKVQENKTWSANNYNEPKYSSPVALSHSGNANNSDNLKEQLHSNESTTPTTNVKSSRENLYYPFYDKRCGELKKEVCILDNDSSITYEQENNDGCSKNIDPSNSSNSTSIDNNSDISSSNGNHDVTKNVEMETAIKKLQMKADKIAEIQKQEMEREVLPELMLLPEIRPAVIKNELHIAPKKKKKIKGCNDKINDLKKHPSPVVNDWCTFSHIVSPFEFYIHVLSEDTVCLDDLNEAVTTTCRRTTSQFSSKSAAMADLGQVCCAYIAEYHQWYRVQILDWLPENDVDLMVQSVDFGFKKTVAYKYLRKITKELAQYPMYAIKCHFPLLFPPESTYKVRLTEWPKESVTSLIDQSGLGDNPSESNFKLFKITFAQQIDDSTAIDLCYLEYEDEKLTVGQILMDSNLAVQITDEYDEDIMALELFVDYEEPDNIVEAILGYDAQDEARICPFTRPNGTCFKGQNCTKEHSMLSKDGITTDKIPTHIKTFGELEVPPKGEMCQVLITESIDACTFYAQIVRNPFRPNNNYFMDKDFYDLLDMMNSKRNISTYKELKVWPAYGEVVIVKHMSKKWLRGVVRGFLVENNEPTKAQVYLVDFGEIIDVPLKDLRQIQESFLRLPFQLVHIYLYNYQQSPNCDIDKMKAFFRKHICRCNFLAVIMSDNAPYKVKLTTYKGSDIGGTLEKEGFATKRTSDCALADENTVMLLE